MITKDGLKFMEVTVKAMIALMLSAFISALLCFLIMAPIKFLFMCSVGLLAFVLYKRIKI